MNRPVNQRLRECRSIPCGVGMWLALMLVCGCSYNTFRANNSDDVPSRYKIEEKHVVLHSDSKLKAGDPLIDELKQLRQQIAQTLELEPGDRQVEVYLFDDEESYQKFLTNNYPGLPPRRAYFVGTSKKLSVYTVWTSKIREDLRHEFTHGVLHGSLSYVPLWLDEGLAEYFEVPGAAGVPREDYLGELHRLLRNGWRPNLQRLEQLDAVGEMQRLDYAESWAWVHWLMHTQPHTRKSLLEYTKNPQRRQIEPLSQRIRQSIGNPEAALTQWIEESSVARPALNRPLLSPGM